MLIPLLLILIVLLAVNGVPRAVNTPGAIVCLLLIILLIVALFGGLGPYSRYPF